MKLFIAILAASVIGAVLALYGFLIYTAVIAMNHTDPTVNVLGAILTAILINGINNAVNNTKSRTNSGR
jgi:uncharacterized membrane protein YfcA